MDVWKSLEDMIWKKHFKLSSWEPNFNTHKFYVVPEQPMSTKYQTPESDLNMVRSH